MAEAAKLQKKIVSKGKLKKSIKSVLCRPDPVFWPKISTEDTSKLEVALAMHKVKLPEYKKPHWKEIKTILKKDRPKPPTIPKAEGLLFGISVCFSALQKQECSAVIIEASVNPHTIVLPILEKCYSTNIPVVCLDNLRKICANCFGITTSCLGIRNNSLPELQSEVLFISKALKHPQISNIQTNVECNMEAEIENKIMSSKTNDNQDALKISNVSNYPYLYRSNTKTRVFIPSDHDASDTITFSGQDLIKFSKDDMPQGKMQMKMILKRLSNNPNRKISRK